MLDPIIPVPIHAMGCFVEVIDEIVEKLPAGVNQDSGRLRLQACRGNS